jgi:ubiquinone/menaquinone biosynthesis C-methylase UbiE
MPDSVIKPPAPAPDYDGFAAAYSARNENSLFNAYYERPEMIRLAGDVTGLEILDAGCGSGALTEALRAKDAVVSGFDLSPAMVDLARQRLGEDADVRVADLGAPLPYLDDRFDLVVASLSLHYVEDWASALAELRRVLKPGGTLHFVEHGLAPDEPVRRWQRRLEPVQKRLFGGCHLTRPVVELLTAAGFTITELDVFYEDGTPKALGAHSLGIAQSP